LAVPRDDESCILKDSIGQLLGIISAIREDHAATWLSGKIRRLAVESETLVNADRSRLGCDRHDIFWIVLPVFRLAAVSIEVTLGIEVIE